MTWLTLHLIRLLKPSHSSGKVHHQTSMQAADSFYWCMILQIQELLLQILKVGWYRLHNTNQLQAQAIMLRSLISKQLRPLLSLHPRSRWTPSTQFLPTMLQKIGNGLCLQKMEKCLSLIFLKCSETLRLLKLVSARSSSWPIMVL